MKLTVGVCTYQRAHLLSITLPVLMQVLEEAATETELIVCDNGSTDTTRSCVASIMGEKGLYLHVGEPGKSRALNAIIARASGDWICFLDDDMIVSKNWIRDYLSAICLHPGSTLFGGSIRPDLHCRPSFISREMLRLYPGVFGILHTTKDIPMSLSLDKLAYGGNFAVKTVHIRSKLFDTRLGMFGEIRISGEDSSVIRNLLAEGHHGWLLSGAETFHIISAQRIGLSSFVRWYGGKGRAAYASGKGIAAHLPFDWKELLMELSNLNFLRKVLLCLLTCVANISVLVGFRSAIVNAEHSEKTLQGLS